jgi:hypothetical protein
LWELSGWAFDDFLRANGDPAQPPGRRRWPKIFPHDPGTLPNREGDLAAGMDEYVNMAKRGMPWDQIAPCPTACAAWNRPARSIWKTGWTHWGSTRCCSRPWPTSARRMPT